VLLVLWILGLVTAVTLGGFVWVALGIGVVLIVASFIVRRRRL
jgi:hypothetical protein